MSTSEESLNNQDPDYVSTTSNDQTQQNIFEENGKHIDVITISDLYVNGFNSRNYVIC